AVESQCESHADFKLPGSPGRGRSPAQNTVDVQVCHGYRPHEEKRVDRGGAVTNDPRSNSLARIEADKVGKLPACAGTKLTTNHTDKLRIMVLSRIRFDTYLI